MKTHHFLRTFLLTLILGFAMILPAMANKDMLLESPAAVSAKNVRQKFVEAVMNPDEVYSVPTSGTAEVTFKINDDGSIDIRKLKASNTEVGEFVKQRIQTVKAEDFVHPYNQYYKINFRFSQN
jgi:hypothetical protein